MVSPFLRQTSATVVGFLIGTTILTGIVYAQITIPEVCTTPGDCTAITPVWQSMAVTGDMSVDTGTLFVDSGRNRVGIGTTNPSAALDVHGHLFLDAETYTALASFSYGTTAGNSIIGNRARGTRSDPAPVQADDSLFDIQAKGFDGDDFRYTTSHVDIRAAENFTPDTLGSYMRFQTTPIGSNIGVERMRITAGGNVGIAATIPSARLDVLQNGNTQPALLLRNGDGNGGADGDVQLAFGWNGTDDYRHWITTRHNALATDNAIEFYTSDGTQNGTFPSNAVLGLTIENGSVGIGTTSPDQALHISGLAKLDPTDTPGTCDSSEEGSFYMDDSMNEPCFCNGTSWTQFDGGGTCS